MVEYPHLQEKGTTKMSEDDIKTYMALHERFDEKFRAIFSVTLENDGTNPEYDGFDLFTDDSVIYFRDFEGDVCQYIFPTSWLDKDLDWVAQEHAKRVEAEEDFYN